MVRQLTKREQKIVDLAMRGGTDKELVILDAIHALEDKFDQTIAEIKKDYPSLKDVLEQIKGKNGYTPQKGVDYSDGQDYTLTEQDKKDIAEKINIPVVEKVIERVTTIKEPTITQVIKEEVVVNSEEIATLAEKRLEENLPKLGETVRNGLELLQGDARLDESAIKGLDEKLKKIEDTITKEKKGKQNAIGVPNLHPMKFYDLSSQTNGSLKVFSVPKNLNGILIGSDFPTVLMEGNGFTLNATRTQVTIAGAVPAPSSGSQLLFQYTSMFNF